MEENGEEDVASLRSEVVSLRAKVKNLEEKLRDEKAAASDRKRKIKSYVESLDLEKARLESDIADLRSRAEGAEARRVEMEQEVESLRESQSRLSKERDRALEDAESARGAAAELETHKSKRLTAKSEMVALARVLEAERERATLSQRRVREIVVPRIVEHAALLRHSIARLDELNTATQRGDRRRPTATHQDEVVTNNPMRRKTSVDSEASSGAGGEIKEMVNMRRSSQSRDALGESLARLERESEQVTSGLNLLSMSIDVLEDTVRAARKCPKPFSDCLDAIFGAAPTSIRAAARGRPRPSDGAEYAKVDLANAHDDDEDEVL